MDKRTGWDSLKTRHSLHFYPQIALWEIDTGGCVKNWHTICCMCNSQGVTIDFTPLLQVCTGINFLI